MWLYDLSVTSTSVIIVFICQPAYSYVITVLRVTSYLIEFVPIKIAKCAYSKQLWWLSGG